MAGSPPWWHWGHCLLQAGSVCSAFRHASTLRCRISPAFFALPQGSSRCHSCGRTKPPQHRSGTQAERVLGSSHCSKELGRRASHELKARNYRRVRKFFFSTSVRLCFRARDFMATAARRPGSCTQAWKVAQGMWPHALPGWIRLGFVGLCCVSRISTGTLSAMCMRRTMRRIIKMMSLAVASCPSCFMPHDLTAVVLCIASQPGGLP